MSSPRPPCSELVEVAWSPCPSAAHVAAAAPQLEPVTHCRQLPPAPLPGNPIQRAVCTWHPFSEGHPDPALSSPPSGICGFLTFGAAVDPDVLLSYPSEDVAVAVARAFIILSVLTSYPILHFCGR